MTDRWILAAIRAARRCDTPLPWARGAPRALPFLFFLFFLGLCGGLTPARLPDIGR